MLFLKKRPLDSFTFLYQLSVTLYTTVSKFCFCSEQPYGWILHFTWRAYFYYHKISPKITIFFQESKRHCQLTLKNPNFPDSNWSLVNFTLFSPSCLSVPMTRTAWCKTKLLSLKISECDWTDTMGKETEIFITPCQVKSHFGTAQSNVSNISKNSYVVV